MQVSRSCTPPARDHRDRGEPLGRELTGPSNVFSDSSACTRARNSASSACGESGRGRACCDEPALAPEPAKLVPLVLADVFADVPVVDALPRVATQSFRVLRVIPMSAAIPRNVAPGVDSYNSTACP